MHLHILGICGTFMGSLALLARQLGHTVTGSDTGIYPPMSTQLLEAGVEIIEGYGAEQLDVGADLIVVGNTMRRGHPVIEAMLDQRLSYTSGPALIHEILLKDKHVLAVAGTHGKTTTTTLLAWILQHAGNDTGFLIGGVPLSKSAKNLKNGNVFSQSAYAGSSDYFVIEADEYDSAFFDKRSKFVHYRPTTAILGNLEFDHADIFENLAAIQKQFHHLVRTIPGSGQIIMPANCEPLEEVIAMGAWTPVMRTQVLTDESTAGDVSLSAALVEPDGSRFEVSFEDSVTEVSWNLSGLHNVHNALAAMAAARSAGVSLEQSAAALADFAGIKRRMEHIGSPRGIDVFDDFAHHPTAIATTLDGARKRFGERRIWAVIEPRSNTMRLGSHEVLLGGAASLADQVIWQQPAGVDWQIRRALAGHPEQTVFDTVDEILDHLSAQAVSGDVIVIMSNGAFGGLHTRLVERLS